MSADLDKLMDFMEFTHEIRRIERTIHFEHDRQENDMEHQYQLALTAWFLIENDKLPLDKSRCVGLSLIHDIVEVYAGDVSVHLPGYDHPDRSKNELRAAKKIEKQWPTFTSYKDMVQEYEARQTPEAKFIYALDKLLPILNIYLYKGRSWHIMGISLEEMKRVKVGKVDVSPEIAEYYRQFLKLVEQKPKLFGSKQ